MKIYDTNKGADSQGRGHYFLRFVHQLSGHVFNFKLKALNAGQGIGEFFFKIFLVVRKFLDKLCADLAGKIRVCHKADFSKDNHAVDVQRPFAFLAVARIVNAEACLIVIFDGIDFVAFFCAVKINLVVFFAVKMSKRKSVRVSVIAEQ